MGSSIHRSKPRPHIGLPTEDQALLEPLRMVKNPSTPFVKSDPKAAQILFEQNKFSEAYTAYKSIIQEMLDAESPNSRLAEFWYKIGLCTYRLKRYEDALKYFEAFMYERIKQNNMIDMAECYWSISQIYIETDRLILASKNLEKSMRLKEKTLVDDEERMAAMYEKFGLAFEEIKDYEKSIECFQRSYEVSKEVLGEQHSDLAVILNKIGQIYVTLEKYDLALENIQKAYNMQKNLADPGISTTLLNQGSVYCRLKKYREALKYALEAKDKRIEEFGETSPEVANCYDVLGLIQQEQGVFEVAQAYFEKSLGIRCEVFDEETAWVALSYFYMGDLYRMKGESGKAKENLGKACSIRAKVFGDNHEKTKKVQHHLKLLGV